MTEEKVTTRTQKKKKILLVLRSRLLRSTQEKGPTEVRSVCDFSIGSTEKVGLTSHFLLSCPSGRLPPSLHISVVHTERRTGQPLRPALNGKLSTPVKRFRTRGPWEVSVVEQERRQLPPTGRLPYECPRRRPGTESPDPNCPREEMGCPRSSRRETGRDVTHDPGISPDSFHPSTHLFQSISLLLTGVPVPI